MQEIQSAKTAADAAFRQKQYALAIRSYDSAVKLSEEHQLPDLLHVLYSNRSAAKLAVRDYQGALVDARASVAVDPQWCKGWYRSARALQGLGKNDLAIQAAQKALQVEPYNDEVQKLLRELQQQCTNSSPTPDQQSTAHLHEQHASQQQQQQQSSNNLKPLSHKQQTTQRQQKLQKLQKLQELHPEQQLPWLQLNQLRSSLQLELLPQQLVTGSEYIPSADGVNQSLLLLLHGLGDKPAAFTALARRMSLPQTASLALSGPHVLPETDGGRGWFTAFDDDWNLIQPHPGETRRINSLQTTVQLLRQHLLPALSTAGGWQPDQIFLFGFSQGGAVALEMARGCRGKQQLGGVVAISASLLEEQLYNISTNTSDSSAASSSGDTGYQGTDVLITHGNKDDVISRATVDKTVQLLKQSGCDVQLKTLPNKGHAMVSSAEEMQACMAFWAARLKVRPADAEFVEVPAEAAAQVTQGLVP